MSIVYPTINTLWSFLSNISAKLSIQDMATSNGSERPVAMAGGDVVRIGESKKTQQ